MFERAQNHVVLCCHKPLFKLLCGRRKHHGRLQPHRILFDRGQIERNHRPLGNLVGLSFGLPILIQSYQQLTVQHPIHAGLQRQRQLLCSAAQQQVAFMRKRAQVPFHKQGSMVLPVYEDARIVAIPVVFGVSMKHLFGAFEGLAPPPPPDGDRVPGLAHRSRTPITRNQQRVLVRPCHGLLAAWQHETALHKLTRLQVHLAQGLRILAPCRQLHQAKLIFRMQACDSFFHPTLLVSFGERIVIQHRFPLRHRCQIILKRCAS